MVNNLILFELHYTFIVSYIVLCVFTRSFAAFTEILQVIMMFVIIGHTASSFARKPDI